MPAFCLFDDSVAVATAAAAAVAVVVCMKRRSVFSRDALVRIELL